MAALPYMQLYVADYLADTMHLTAETHGAYLLLLMNYWQTGKPLVDDDNKLAFIARSTSVERWLEIRSDVVEFFDQRDGLLVHQRVEKDLEKVRSKSRQASEAGKASAKKRQNNKEKTDTCNGRSISVERKSNHKDTDIDKDKESSVTKVTEGIAASAAPDVQKAYDEFTLVALSSGIPAPRRLTPDYRKKIETRLRAIGIAAWREGLEKIPKTPFLLGQNDRGWKLDLTAFCQPQTFNRIIEGFYNSEKTGFAQRDKQREIDEGIFAAGAKYLSPAG